MHAYRFEALCGFNAPHLETGRIPQTGEWAALPDQEPEVDSCTRVRFSPAAFGEVVPSCAGIQKPWWEVPPFTGWGGTHVMPAMPAKLCNHNTGQCGKRRWKLLLKLWVAGRRLSF